jgi:RNA polymerase sigma factor
MQLTLAGQGQESPLPPEETVFRIRDGREDLRSPFIDRYQPFIASVTSRLINAPAQGRDEFSVAMAAFNEAIDRFDPVRSRSFLAYSDLVINHRVIDYMRRNRRHELAYPFTYYEAAGHEGVVERAVLQNPAMLSDHIEIKEEIGAFRERLLSFGIKLGDLVKCAPRHIDSKAMCAGAARAIVASPAMSEKLERTKQLPVAQLLESVRIGRKAVENNRKYIIAIYIILTSGMEIIKGYIDFVEEGESGK